MQCGVLVYVCFMFKSLLECYCSLKKASEGGAASGAGVGTGGPGERLGPGGRACFQGGVGLALGWCGDAW